MDAAADNNWVNNMWNSCRFENTAPSVAKLGYSDADSALILNLKK